MKKRYVIVLAGIVMAAFMLSGCGAGRVNQNGNNSSTRNEEELQAEIDALQQEIDDLKSAQGQQDDGTADDGQAEDSARTTDDSAAQSNAQSSTGQASGSTAGANVAVTLEEAQNIALERVPGATAEHISIELDEDDGWYIYEGDILYNRMEYEFEIDANTGNILKWEEERW